MEEKHHFKLALMCDLKEAARHYEVDIEEIDIRQYYTPFEVSAEDSNSLISIACAGCNEIIEVQIIEIPRINNFTSVKFLIQLLIILSFVFLPSLNFQIAEIALFTLVGIGLIAFLYDVYSYMFKPPARLNTLFYWHAIEYYSDDMNVENEQQVYPDSVTNR